MKKKYAIFILYIAAFLITAVNTFFSLKNYLFTDINELPKGEIVSEQSSPSGDKTVNVYLVKNSIGTAIRGELVMNGSKTNIFWQTGISEIGVRWGNNDIVYFNNVPVFCDGEKSYDCRRGTSIFDDGSIEYEPPETANE